MAAAIGLGQEAIRKKMSEPFGGECLAGLIAEAQEFGDIGARDKGLWPGAGEDGAFDILVAIDLFDDFAKLADHGPC